MSLTVIILTLNEELHLARCIRSLEPLGASVLVVDSGSQDATVVIAESLGATVLFHPWTNYASQFQWAIDNDPFSSEWVMRLDADEYLNEAARTGLSASLDSAAPCVTGFNYRLRNIFLGKRIRFGGYDPLLLLRVWRRGVGRMESRWMDEHILLSHGEIKEAPGEIMHNNLNTHHWWTSKHNSYANREAVDILARKYGLWISAEPPLPTSTGAKAKRFLKERFYNKSPFFFRSACYFFARYFIFLGFLDGKEGFAYHFFQAFWYRSLVDIRVIEIEMLFRDCSTKSERLQKLRDYTNLPLPSEI